MFKKCIHNRQKSQCKDCRGCSICEHNRRKSICKDCGGSQICEHNRLKSHCKDCGGSQICEHNRLKSQCKDCGGSQICEHNRLKSQCKDCGGNRICKHNRRKSECKDCGGSQICEHNRLKRQCKDCSGSSICEHNIRKYRCKDCGGSELCQNEWCLTIENAKYKHYCLFCFIKKFPNEKVARNYKIKEKHVVDCILQKFPTFTWFHDKTIKDGCSLRRPDLFVDYGSHVIMVEIDEQKHESYDCSCINRRTMELSLDINHRPCVIIRFNPDGYIDQHNNKIKSPWQIHKKLGVLLIMKTHEEEWNNRLKNLLDCIDYWTQNPTDKMIEMIELYY